MVKEELYHFSVGTVAGMTGMICVFPIGKLIEGLQKLFTKPLLNPDKEKSEIKPKQIKVTGLSDDVFLL